MREQVGWLDAMVGSMRCASCGVPYAQDDLRVVGHRDEYWFLRCTCHVCRREGVAVVIVREAGAADAREARPRPPALTVDDVLSAHELLRDYTGDVNGLFGADRSARR